MYTEEQAKTKWCCESRNRFCQAGDYAAENRFCQAGDYAAENRFCQAGDYIHQKTASWQNCIASDCMKWRWAKLSHKGFQMGYCGLAGRDEG